MAVLYSGKILSALPYLWDLPKMEAYYLCCVPLNINQFMKKMKLTFQMKRYVNRANYERRKSCPHVACLLSSNCLYENAEVLEKSGMTKPGQRTVGVG